MQLTNLQIVLICLAAFFTSAFLTPIFRKLAIRLDVVDQPNQAHKTHKIGVPYFGGLAIISTVIIGIICGYVFLDFQTVDLRRVMLFLFPPIFLGMVGLLDDIINLGAFSRFIAQTLSSLFVAFVFSINGLFGAPSTSTIVNIAISAFWIVGITNAFNFIDNLDGGAGGIAVLGSLALVISALISGQYIVAGLGALILGGSLGFLIWNLYPARIYLGDAGALFIGSLLSILLVRLEPMTPSVRTDWFVPVFVMAIPIMDTSVAVISRILRGISPFTGGRDHLSHRLIRLGLNRRQAAVSLWLLVLFFASISIALQLADQRQADFLTVFGLISWMVLAIFFFRIAHSDEAKKASSR